MRDELERFVASLAIPDDRKAVVLAELADHVACATEAAVREGLDPEAAARAALGSLEPLRRSLEAIEPAFRITRWHALARGVVAGLLAGIVLDQGGTLMRGVVGAVVVLAIVAVSAPPRVLDLLRAELRARPIRGGARGIALTVPIGPALTYAFTVMCVPFFVWMSMIAVRAQAGNTHVDIPVSAFAIVAAVYMLLLVEGIRARRKAAA